MLWRSVNTPEQKETYSWANLQMRLHILIYTPVPLICDEIDYSSNDLITCRAVLASEHLIQNLNRFEFEPESNCGLPWRNLLKLCLIACSSVDSQRN